jgi:hypothetical protein
LQYTELQLRMQQNNALKEYVNCPFRLQNSGTFGFNENLNANRDVIFDVSTTHPVRDGPVASNDCIPGEAARARELDKIMKYEKDAAARGLKIVPLIFETSGFVAEPAVKLIKMLAYRRENQLSLLSGRQLLVHTHFHLPADRKC